MKTKQSINSEILTEDDFIRILNESESEDDKIEGKEDIQSSLLENDIDRVIDQISRYGTRRVTKCTVVS